MQNYILEMKLVLESGSITHSIYKHDLSRWKCSISVESDASWWFQTSSL